MNAMPPDATPSVAHDVRGYRDLVEAIPAATFVIQEDMFVFANLSAVAMMKADNAEQLLGRLVMDFIDSDHQSRAAQRFNQVYAGVTDTSVREYAVRRLDGTSLVVAVRSVPITYDEKPASLTVCIDISEHHAVELALRKSEKRYRDLIEHLPLATWVEHEGILDLANPAALRLVGAASPGDVVGKPFLDFIRADGHPQIVKRLERIAAGEEPTEPLECALLRLDGGEAHVQAHMLPITFAGQDGVLAVTVDVTEKKAAEAEIERANALLRTRFEEVQKLQQQMYEQAIKDGLTGLYNRRYFDETFERELHRGRRDKADLAVLILDIDRFKMVNDTFGHQAGDEVLRSLAGVLGEKTRAGDIPCRYGGEEFVVVMPGATIAAAYKRAEQLRTAFAAMEVDLGDGRVWRGTLSAGVAVYPTDGSDARRLVACADEALYAAKHEGRNRTKRFSDLQKDQGQPS